MRNIRGKKTLITGAASGIGRALALAMAREGADLYLLDIDKDGLDETVQEASKFRVQAIGSSCDVSCPEQITESVQRLLQEWKTLDILINNAGVAYYGPTKNMTPEQWNWLLAINLHAPIRFTHELLPTLLSRPEAHLLNVASIMGLVAGPRTIAYQTSKFGLVGFSEGLRSEVRRTPLGVTALCPGPVITPLFENSPSGRQGKKMPTPPRWACATPERVAACAVRAIYRNKRLALVTPLAHVLYKVKQFAPGLLDFAASIGHKTPPQPAPDVVPLKLPGQTSVENRASSHHSADAA